MTDDIQDGGLDRRSVLRRGAILGGAMVWTVPTVQSLAGPAFATGTAEICQVILAGRVDAFGTFTETSSTGVDLNNRTARVDLYDQESFDINSEVSGQHILVQSRNAANTAAGTTWRFVIDSVGSTSNDTDQCPETVTINGTGAGGTELRLQADRGHHLPEHAQPDRTDLRERHGDHARRSHSDALHGHRRSIEPLEHPQPDMHRLLVERACAASAVANRLEAPDCWSGASGIVQTAADRDMISRPRSTRPMS